MLSSFSFVYLIIIDNKYIEYFLIKLQIVVKFSKIYYIMSLIVIRLKEYLDFKGIKYATAETSIGVSNGSLSKPFKLKTTIKTDTLEKFLSVYTDINPIWLLTGEGKKTKEINFEHSEDKEDIEKLSKTELKIQIEAKDNLITFYKNIHDLNELKLTNSFKNQEFKSIAAINKLEKKIEENIKISQKLQEQMEEFFDYTNLKDNIEIAKKRNGSKKEENNNH